MIVKDEQTNILSTIESLALLGDLLREVCIYDTGSTDDTIQLARAAGARVKQGFWDDDFSRARNCAAGMAASPWLFVVDGDEVLSHCEVAGLRSALAACPGDVDALALPVRVTSEVDGESRTWASPRLYRPDRLHYVRPVHAELSAFDDRRPVVRELPQSVLRMDNQGFGTDRLMRSWERVERIATRAMTTHDAGVDRYLLIDRGRARKGRGLVQEALADLRHAASLPPTGYDYDVWGLELLGELLLERGEIDEALTVVESIDSLTPGAPAAVWLLGGCLASLGANVEAFDRICGMRAFPSVFGAVVDELTIFRTCLVRAIDSGSEPRILASLIALSQFSDARAMVLPAMQKMLPPGYSIDRLLHGSGVRSPADILARLQAA